MRHRPPMPGDVFELRVTLRHITPPVWRTLHVPADMPLGILHDVIQLAFGWVDCHLHDFHVGDIRFATPSVEDGDVFCVDEDAAPIGAVARVGTKLVYNYDFGDDWEHDVKVVSVQNVLSGAVDPLACTDGARACPPEDCGGPHGYARMLEALANKKHPDHAEMKEWIGSFDAEKLDLTAVNKRLGVLAKELGLRPRAAKGAAARSK